MTLEQYPTILEEWTKNILLWCVIYPGKLGPIDLRYIFTKLAQAQAQIGIIRLCYANLPIGESLSALVTNLRNNGL